MPENRLRVSDLRTGHTGYSTGFAIGATSGRLAYNDGANLARFIGGASFVSKTASFTVTSEDDGKTFEFDSTTSIIATLPAAGPLTTGMRVTFVNGQLTAAGGHALSPAVLDKIIYGPTTAVDNKDLVISAATDRVGDMVTVQCDGVDGWYVISVIGTLAAEP